jgi:DNA-binding NarL/FixJ family response regulator
MISIMVVDDNAAVRRTLREILEVEPTLEVVGEAADGIDALALAQQVLPSVILMDLQMPRMNGIEATRLLHAVLPNIVIIGMSCDASQTLEREALSAGAAAFIPKELLPGNLLSVIAATSRASAIRSEEV